MFKVIYKKSDGAIKGCGADFKGIKSGFDVISLPDDIYRDITDIDAFGEIGLKENITNLADIPGIADILKADIRNKLNKARELEWEGGFEHNGYVFDSNGRSESLIRGAAKIAASDPDYTETWTLADNSEITLNAADLIALNNALTAHGGAVFKKYRELKKALETMTLAELIAY